MADLGHTFVHAPQTTQRPLSTFSTLFTNCIHLLILFLKMLIFDSIKEYPAIVCDFIILSRQGSGQGTVPWPLHGVPINAAEFTNEPNMMEETGFPKGYTPADYRRDQDLFFKWLRANYPDCICVGPSTTGGDNISFGKGNGEKKAGGGGDTWASTYLDVFRTLNELGGFASLTNGVIFHNTLASSDYGFLAREVFDPRPNYFAVLLWNRLMGTTVYDTAEPTREGAHVYAHSRKDGKDGVVYLIINNSLTESTTVELPKDADRYTLAGENGNVRATVMTLNGKPLVL